jgi:purine-cytosine permease-like protein
MEDPKYQKLAEELADLQRQVRNLRLWLFFIVGLLVVLVLFGPNAITWILGGAAFLFVAAFVVSHFSASSPTKSHEETGA